VTRSLPGKIGKFTDLLTGRPRSISARLDAATTPPHAAQAGKGRDRGAARRAGDATRPGLAVKAAARGPGGGPARRGVHATHDPAEIAGDPQADPDTRKNSQGIQYCSRDGYNSGGSGAPWNVLLADEDPGNVDRVPVRASDRQAALTAQGSVTGALVPALVNHRRPLRPAPGRGHAIERAG
jgi:hypothetical protein